MSAQIFLPLETNSFCSKGQICRKNFGFSAQASVSLNGRKTIWVTGDNIFSILPQCSRWIPLSRLPFLFENRGV